MRCCVRCSPISRSTSSPEVGSYEFTRMKRNKNSCQFVSLLQKGHFTAETQSTQRLYRCRTLRSRRLCGEFLQ
jgi:hypothetical protein